MIQFIYCAVYTSGTCGTQHNTRVACSM